MVMRVSQVLAAGTLLAILVLCAPVALSAQTSGEATSPDTTENADLEVTIRAALLTDPRTAQMSEEEIDEMVAALAEGAQEQGITPHDITWRPQPPITTEGEDAPCMMPAFFCTLGAAFGLDGSDVTMPIVLGIVSGILLFVIGALLHHRYGHHPVAGKIEAGGSTQNLAPRSPVPPSTPPSPPAGNLPPRA